jgi:hypothetical protein
MGGEFGAIDGCAHSILDTRSGTYGGLGDWVMDDGGLDACVERLAAYLRSQLKRTIVPLTLSNDLTDG